MDDEKLERDAAKILFSAPVKAEEAAASTAPCGPEIPFVCPFCGEAYTVSAELAGTAITCRNCRELSRVDANKKSRSTLDRSAFWSGLAVGVGLTLAAVLILKLVRLL